jgi:plasmid stability protein
MAILHVRNIPDDLYARIRERAVQEHRSLSAEVLAALEERFPHRPPVRELLESIERRARLHPLPPGAPDAVDLIREDRER